MFEWEDAFFPHRKRLPWLFEHKRPLSPGVFRAWRTWLRALVPPLFWRSVTPAHGTSGAVVLWPLVLMASMIAIGGAIRVGYLYAIGWAGTWTAWGGGPPTGWKRAGVIAVEAWSRPLWVRWQDYWNTENYLRALGETYAPIASVTAGSLVCALALMSLTTSRRICGVKASHILRASVYRLAPLGLLYVLWLVEAMLVSYRLPSLWNYQAVGLSRTVLLFALLAWGAWWWRTVILSGWQMHKAALAANLIAACDVLASLAAYAVLAPYSMGRMLI